jgi:hypothetical protein
MDYPTKIKKRPRPHWDEGALLRGTTQIPGAGPGTQFDDDCLLVKHYHRTPDNVGRFRLSLLVSVIGIQLSVIGLLFTDNRSPSFRSAAPEGFWANCLGLTCTCLRLAVQLTLAYSSPSQLFVNRWLALCQNGR